MEYQTSTHIRELLTKRNGHTDRVPTECRNELVKRHDSANATYECNGDCGQDGGGNGVCFCIDDC